MAVSREEASQNNNEENKKRMTNSPRPSGVSGIPGSSRPSGVSRTPLSSRPNEPDRYFKEGSEEEDDMGYGRIVRVIKAVYKQ